jgi:hemerythrin-like metal-binding protein
VRSLQWTEEDSVYVPELDEEHQAMYRLAQDLRHAVVEGEPPVNLALKAQCLADEVADHFRHEEGLMREARYPQVEWHKRQHATARAQLATLAASIHTGEPAAIFDSLEAIAKWMRDHTGIADRMAGAYLRNHLRALAR